jgi:hypothetical protein
MYLVESKVKIGWSKVVNGEASPNRCQLKLALSIAIWNLFSVIGGVASGETAPLLGKIIEGEDGRDGANWNAGAAIDALDRVDIKQLLGGVGRLVLFGVDAVDRASIHTRRVLGSDAGFCYDVCHVSILTTII